MNTYSHSTAPWKPVLLIAMAIASVTATGCAHNPRELFSLSRKKTPPTHHGKYQTGTSAKDEMTRRIDLALKAADLNGYDIAVQYEEGTAMLAGAVRTRQQKELASQVVSQIPGVRRVDNRLTSTGHAPTSTYTAAKFRRPDEPTARANPAPRPQDSKLEEKRRESFIRMASTSTEDLQDPFLDQVEHADFQEVDGDQNASKIEQIAQRAPQPSSHQKRFEPLANSEPRRRTTRTNALDSTKSFDEIFNEAVARQDQDTVDLAERYEELPPARSETSVANASAIEPREEERFLADASPFSEAEPLVSPRNPFAEDVEPERDRQPEPDRELLPPQMEVVDSTDHLTEWKNASGRGEFDEGPDSQPNGSQDTVALAGLETSRKNFIVESTQVTPRVHTSPLVVPAADDSTDFVDGDHSKPNPFAEMQAAIVPRDEPASRSPGASTELAQNDSAEKSRFESFSKFRRSVQTPQGARLHSNSGATVLGVDSSPAGWSRESRHRTASSASSGFVPKRAEQLTQLSESLQPDDPAPAPPLSDDLGTDAEAETSAPAVATFLAPVTFDDEPRAEDAREPISTGASLLAGLLLIVACLVGVGLRQRLPSLRRRFRI